MFLIIALYAVFAAMTFINSKLMLTNPYPFFVGMMRALGSGTFLILYNYLFNRAALRNFSLPISGWRDLLVFGGFVHGLVMCGFSYSVQYVDPVKICFILAASPFITAILQYFLDGETLSKKKVFGLVIGFCGLVPILAGSDHGVYAAVPAHLELLGSIVCFTAIVLFAYGWIVKKRFLKKYSYPLTIVNGIAMLAGGCVSSMLFAFFHASTRSVISFSPEFSFLMAAFVISSLLTYLLYAYLLKIFSATFIAFAGFLEPVFGMLFGAALMNHPITKTSLASLFVLAFGLYMFYQEELKASKQAIMK